MAEASTIPKQCSTCQWFGPSGLCREPRNLGTREMVAAGGENMVLMVPMIVQPMHLCDYWTRPKPANLRMAG